MSNPTDRQAVRDALQTGYGDATQTVLDDRVAGQVIQSLRDRGWCSPDEVAAIVLAAGGEVTVPDEILMHADQLQVEVFDDFALGKRIRARRRP